MTRTYLAAIWSDPQVAFLIGGGNEGVSAIVKDAQESGFVNVFAVIDRDYRQSNKADWLTSGKTFRRFILPVHEIENYVLDSAALCESRFNNLQRTREQIDAMMRMAAGRLCWWAACRDVVAEMRRRFREGFLNDPPCSIPDHAEAMNHICRSPWFMKLAAEVGRTTESEIGDLLSKAHTRANGLLADGGWMSDFAGKEILRDVGSRIFDRTKPSKQQISPAQLDEDLAKEVGAWQKRNNLVPDALNELLAALRQRIARGSP